MGLWGSGVSGFRGFGVSGIWIWGFWGFRVWGCRASGLQVSSSGCARVVVNNVTSKRTPSVSQYRYTPSRLPSNLGLKRVPFFA